VFFNGVNKYSCANISTNKEIKTAGHFVLGQSHKETFFQKQISMNISSTIERNSFLKNKNEGLLFEDNWDSIDPYYQEFMNDDDLDAYYTEPLDKSRKMSSKFNPHSSFVGRLFNFNVWNYAKNSESILNLYSDCKLSFCGNATQWSDFRQGTRGQVKMKWPTKLLWKSMLFLYYTVFLVLYYTVFTQKYSNQTHILSQLYQRQKMIF
jgi:hypothetical protein